MEIKRDRYLSELEAMRHTGFVKIITGIRRCGKSYLLFNLFYNNLLNVGVDVSHIIKVDLDSFQNRKLRNPDELYQYLDKSIRDNGMHYFLLDEIQLVDDFADVLNSFLRRSNVDIYVTGSNARLLSKDVITEFRGRGHEIRMYPLSFKEYMSVYEGTVQKGLDEYMTFGGLPQIFDYTTEAQNHNSLSRCLPKPTFVTLKTDITYGRMMTLKSCLTSFRRTSVVSPIRTNLQTRLKV